MHIEHATQFSEYKLESTNPSAVLMQYPIANDPNFKHLRVCTSSSQGHAAKSQEHMFLNALKCQQVPKITQEICSPIFFIFQFS